MENHRTFRHRAQASGPQMSPRARNQTSAMVLELRWKAPPVKTIRTELLQRMQFPRRSAATSYVVECQNNVRRRQGICRRCFDDAPSSAVNPNV
mmetsp:Transcript_45612/g.74354  ORF Transcript_45612/g.74354 Transcript_45612/m.74354 type:complete len:94 (-) Transcript_45612:127-408(-)